LHEPVRQSNIDPVRPTAKSLVLDLLSTLKSGAMPVRALIAASELFGIDANATRVALARLLADGLVASDERGAYRLGHAAASVFEHVSSWRTIEDRVRAWDGGWIAALTSGVPRSARARARATGRALGLLGFRELERGLGIRPDNLRGGIQVARERLLALGADDAVIVFALRGLDEATEERARGLWNVEDLRATYRAQLDAIAVSTKRLARLTPEQAMAESFLVGGATLRAIARDPLLPEPLAPVGDRRALLAAMQSYDRIGRACWAAFMRAHGAPYRRTPHDLRVLDEPMNAIAAGGAIDAGA
jgi:phenylacetic acid degradation operon negative regulatory protein